MFRLTREDSEEHEAGVTKRSPREGKLTDIETHSIAFTRSPANQRGFLVTKSDREAFKARMRANARAYREAVARGDFEDTDSRTTKTRRRTSRDTEDTNMDATPIEKTAGLDGSGSLHERAERLVAARKFSSLAKAETYLLERDPQARASYMESAGWQADPEPVDKAGDAAYSELEARAKALVDEGEFRLTSRAMTHLLETDDALRRQYQDAPVPHSVD